MSEQEIKAICKYFIENRGINDFQKEVFKQAVDQSRNWMELFTVMAWIKGYR